jgi:hypothetical protein
MIVVAIKFIRQSGSQLSARPLRLRVSFADVVKAVNSDASDLKRNPAIFTTHVD